MQIYNSHLHDSIQSLDHGGGSVGDNYASNMQIYPCSRTYVPRSLEPWLLATTRYLGLSCHHWMDPYLDINALNNLHLCMFQVWSSATTGCLPILASTLPFLSNCTKSWWMQANMHHTFQDVSDCDVFREKMWLEMWFWSNRGSLSFAKMLLNADHSVPHHSASCIFYSH